jgi:hypothetical protein
MRQSPLASPAAMPLFAVWSTFGTVEPPRLLPLWKWLHPIASPYLFLSLITYVIEVSPLLPPSHIKEGATRAPPLFTVPTMAPISPPRVRNHLPLRAPPAASVEHRRVWPSPQLRLQVAPLVRNPTASSFSLSYHDDLPRLRAAAMLHGSRASHGPVMHKPDPWLFL